MKYEGIDYVCEGYTKTLKPKRRKATREDMERTWAACERSRRASDAIRAKYDDLPPVPDNNYRRELRARLGR